MKIHLDETQREIRKLFYSGFLIENGLKQGGALSPLLLHFALQYAINTVHETNLGLDMNGTHEALAYADDVNLIGDDIRIQTNEDVLLNAMGKLSTWRHDVITAYRICYNFQ